MRRPSMHIIKALTLAVVLVASAANAGAQTSVSGAPFLGVGPQYDTTHVYVAPDDFDRFVTMS